MYINIEDEYYYRPYYDLSRNETKFLNAAEALTIGNLFEDLYEPYKHYKPRALTAKTEKERAMLKIQEESFVMNDLNLYLDLHPEDMEAMQLFKRCAMNLKELCNMYSEKYGALELEKDLGPNYDWCKTPWPWEVDNV